MRSREDGGTYFTQVKMKNQYKILVQDLKRRDHLGDLGVAGR
jgi:hypothetical protein